MARMTLRLSRLVVWALLAIGCADPAVASREAVVYGTDDRIEVYEETNAAIQSVAETAVGIQMDRGWVDETDPSNVQITYTQTLGEAQNLCAGERFADQIEPGMCSGTLIDDQYLLTAGHCQEAPSDCTDNVWVLGFRYESDGVLAPLTSDDVYSCSRVIAYFDDGNVDYAVVELDRPVVGHTPAPVLVEPTGLAHGTPVTMIGHPDGIPMKIDDGGQVTWNSSDVTYLNATVDAFAGNSGSGVFDTTGHLVALLRGGMTDYTMMGGCNIVNVIDPPPTDDGEQLVYMKPIIAALCSTPGVTSVLCDCSGPCVPEPPGDTCDTAETIDAVSQTLDGTLDGYTPTEMGSCGGAGPERMFTFTVDHTVYFTATSEGYDSVLYLRDGCMGSELDCNDDISRRDHGSQISATLSPGTYVLFLDAYDSTVDTYTLTLSFTDGAPDAGVVADAGAPDAGAPDAGTIAQNDAGAPSSDAGAPDAGTATSMGGCGCHAAGGPTRSHLGWLLPLLALAGLRRRRAR